MSDLLKLAERVEAATGPDRELDIAIALTLPAWTYGGKPGRFYSAGPYYEGASDRIGFQADDGANYVPGNAPDMMVPEFTASLDAAMSLVPEGAQVLLSSIDPDEKENDGRWYSIAGDPESTRDSSSGATPALALTAAALRAHHAMQKGTGK